MTKKTTEISRRSFMAGSLAALAMSASVLAGCSKSEGSSNEEWDYETDVIVVGFGGAGATAAVGASEAGASVILLEKAPEADAGGNTSVSGGGARITSEATIEQFAASMKKITAESQWNEDEFAGVAKDLSRIKGWMEDHGANLTYFDTAADSYHGQLGLTGMFNVGGTGYSLFQFLKGLVENAGGIQIMYETPATNLVFNQETKEVYGVIARNSADEIIRIKAKKGVILACGGFEANQAMRDTYYAPAFPIYPMGTPYNTGDGIHMLGEVGANLRGFNSIEWGVHCNKKGSDEVGVALAYSFMRPDDLLSSIIVNAKGKRFVGETQPGFCGPTVLRPLHDKNQLPELTIDWLAGPDIYKYTNLPMFMICDSSRAEEGPIFTSASAASGNTWANLHDWYTWSDDNQAEVQNGWLEKCDTIEELAEKLGVDPAGLKATVDAYNAACETGEDEFPRSIEMRPIVKAPFYGCELGLGLINTQGGAKRTGKSEVLDLNDQVIPRLYTAGELGSVYSWQYPGALNISETLCGFCVGEHAAALEPWE